MSPQRQDHSLHTSDSLQTEQKPDHYSTLSIKQDTIPQMSLLAILALLMLSFIVSIYNIRLMRQLSQIQRHTRQPSLSVCVLRPLLREIRPHLQLTLHATEESLTQRLLPNRYQETTCKYLPANGEGISI